MNPQALFAVFLGFAAVTAAVPSLAASPDGLVRVHSRHLDELYIRPDANLPGYRKVMIDPVRVGFHKDWLRYGAYMTVRPVGEDHAKRIAYDIASDAQANIAEAFRARGYEIVNAPGPGVLRLSPGVADLYVNAPDRFSPFRTTSFTREAGQAVLVLDVRDAVSGTLLGRVAHLGIAEQMGRFMRANDVSNRFWFDAMSRRWAASCAAGLGPH
jgi:uncharacterized protein DUF3313